MSSPNGGRPGVPEVAGPADPDAIRADIEATRDQLGRTIDELSHRLDVPARARERVERARETALDVYLKNPPAIMGGLALVAIMVGVVIMRRTRTSSRRKR